MFKVGQRVRLVHTYRLHYLRGAEGTITEIDENDTFHPYMAVFQGSSEKHWPSPGQIEPILDDKQRERSQEETVPWELCCFSREGKYVELEETA